jgi:hypothetical protein
LFLFYNTKVSDLFDKAKNIKSQCCVIQGNIEIRLKKEIWQDNLEKHGGEVSG